MTQPRIHPTAIVDPAARLGADVAIGPYCVIGPQVVLGDGVTLHSHVVVAGDTVIGAQTEIYSFAAIGHAPQDLKYAGEPVKLVIGARNRIREHVTMNPGTGGGGALTQVGDDCLFMVGSHVAHDCMIGDHVILANNATLAGHVTVGDYAVLGGLSAVHQFTRIGQFAMIGGMAGIEHDVIPYGSAVGNRASLGGLNLVGMKRRGFDREAIHAVRAAFRMIFEGEEGGLLERAEAAGREWANIAPVQEIVSFMRADSKRSFCTLRA